MHEDRLYKLHRVIVGQCRTRLVLSPARSHSWIDARSFSIRQSMSVPGYSPREARFRRTQ